MIKFIVVQQQLKVVTPIIVESTLNYLEAEASFTEDWDSLYKWVHFFKDGTTCDMPMLNDKINAASGLNLPAGTWEVWITGLDVNHQVRATTNVELIKVEATTGNAFPAVSPSLSEVLATNVSNAVAVANSVREDADDGEFNGATFLPSVAGDGTISWTNDKELTNPESRNIKGPKGDRGYSGVYCGSGDPPADCDVWIDPDGDPGEGTLSVTVEEITGGHRVTFTDDDHPTGQSFNVLDGERGLRGPKGDKGDTGDEKLYICTYGTATATQIATALAAGKHPIVQMNGWLRYQYTYETDDYYYFNASYSKSVHYARLNKATNEWENGSNAFYSQGEIDASHTAIYQTIATKQEKLVAGTGISIAADGKTISAYGGGSGGGSGNGDMLISDYDSDYSVRTAGGISAFVNSNGGKIDKIKLNNVEQEIANKTVSLTETDPTVPNWAKQQNKPSYDYSEIENTPSIPSVPSWALAPNKPSYNYNEITDKPNGISPLLGKRIAAFGDSIVKNSDYCLDGFVKILAEKYGMTYTNEAVNGATLGQAADRTQIWSEIYASTNIDAADYIILEGGINDAWSGFNVNCQVGSPRNGWVSPSDITTTCGGLEKILYVLKNNYPSKKILFVFPHGGMFESENSWERDYKPAINKILIKYSIPCIDISSIAPYMGPHGIGNLGDTYTADGAHPNSLGYSTWYVDAIAQALINLSNVPQIPQFKVYNAAYTSGTMITSALAIGIVPIIWKDGRIYYYDNTVSNSHNFTCAEFSNVHVIWVNKNNATVNNWSTTSSSLICEPSSDGTAGQVLTTDGNGGRSWTTVAGGSGSSGITEETIVTTFETVNLAAYTKIPGLYIGTITVSKTGYKPIGIVGIETDVANAIYNFPIVYKVYPSGSVYKVTAGFRCDDSSKAASSCTAWIQWLKIT